MFTARTEALARAMCVALGVDPDKEFAHGYDYSPRPVIKNDNGIAAVPAVLCYSPQWHRFAWQAQKWIFEHSGGQFTGNEKETA